MIERLKSASRTLFHRGRQRLTVVPRPLSRLRQGGRERALLDEVRERGIAVIEDFVDPAQCAAWVAEIERVFTERESRLWRSTDGADVRAFAIETASDELRPFNDDPFLTRLAEQWVGQRQLPFFTLANRIRPTPGNLGSGGGWHRDTAAEHQFKALLYLTDVGPTNGPFEFVPTSHRVRSYLRTILGGGAEFGQYRFSDDQLANACAALGQRPVTLTGRAGTLLLADTSGLHRGRPIEQGQRYALTNYYLTPQQVDASWRNEKFVGYFVGLKPRVNA